MSTWGKKKKIEKNKDHNDEDKEAVKSQEQDLEETEDKLLERSRCVILI